MTTLRRLFRRDSDAATVAAVRACEVPLPSTLRADCPASLEAIIQKALARDPDDRFASARELSDALRSFLEETGRHVTSVDVERHMTAAFADRLARRRQIEAVAAKAQDVAAFFSTLGEDTLVRRAQLAPPHIATRTDVHCDLESERSEPLLTQLLPELTRVRRSARARWRLVLVLVGVVSVTAFGTALILRAQPSPQPEVTAPQPDAPTSAVQVLAAKMTATATATMATEPEHVAPQRVPVRRAEGGAPRKLRRKLTERPAPPKERSHELIEGADL